MYHVNYCVVFSAAVDTQKLINDLEKHFDTYGPISVGLEKEENSVPVAKMIYNHYLGDITSAGNHFDQLTEVCRTDRILFDAWTLKGDVFFCHLSIYTILSVSNSDYSLDYG